MQKQKTQTGMYEGRVAQAEERKRLMQLVMALSREVDVLKEDNLQLRAAVKIYRELLEGTPARALNHAPAITPRPPL
jgi:hypothetical protein